jgi:hypothetical protein
MLRPELGRSSFGLPHQTSPSLPMKYPHRILILATLLLAPLARSAEPAANPVWGRAADNHIFAQQLVNELMAAHPELVVIGLHATVPGAKDETMIATNLDRVGKVDDDDDIAVAKEHKTILAPNQKDPNKFEVQVPLKDRSGKFLGASAGFVFKYHAGDDEVELHQKALAIRDALAAKTPDLATLLQPTAH